MIAGGWSMPARSRSSALPAVWLVNREDDGSVRPNVAAVGPAVGDVTESTTPATIDPMGDVSPQFLGAADAVTAEPSGPVLPVIGTEDGAVLATGTAIFRRSVGDPRTCVFSGVPRGSHVVVVNVANDRSTDCWTALRPIDEPQGEMVMNAAAFATIADPTSAPIHVEVRQP